MIDLGEVTILTAEGPVANGGADLDIALPLNSTVIGIAIFPIGASTPDTSVAGYLYTGENLITQIVPLSIASADANHVNAVIRELPLSLPQDRSYLFRTHIYNLTGAVVIWRVVVIMEAGQFE